MAPSREVVAEVLPQPRRNLRKVVQLAVCAVVGLLLWLYMASQQSEAVAAARGTEETKRSLALVPDRKAADRLAELARVKHERAVAASANAVDDARANANGPAEERGRPRLAKVSDVIAQSMSEGEIARADHAGANAWDVGDGAETSAGQAANRTQQIVESHRERVLQRRLQALEEAMFADSMRGTNTLGAPQAKRGSGRAAPTNVEDEEGEVPMRGLNALSNALLEQSAAQARGLPGAPGPRQGLGGALEALHGLAVQGIGAATPPMENGAAANRLAFFQNGGTQLQPGYLAATVRKPLSPYELKMGTVLPGVLITAVHSESPGQILGQISENIYDTATQEHLLIPQGTKAVGTYSGTITMGQERVQVASVQLNFPNGDALDLGGMSVADATGQAGLSDRVNNHILARVGALLVSTAATAGYEVTAPSNPFGVETAVHRALGESIIKAANDMAQRQSQIPPTIEVRAGKRFAIMMNKDVVFPGPYQDEHRHRARDYRRANRRAQ